MTTTETPERVWAENNDPRAAGDKCAQCVYFFPQYNKECRYNPPFVLHELVSAHNPETAYRRWPRVENDDWCGNFSKTLPAAYTERNS